MCEAPSRPDNLFTTCAIHLSLYPQWLMRRDPPCRHANDEAIDKMDRFCHKIYKFPITWLCSYGALQKYGDKLRRFVSDYGDEVAIYEHGIACAYALDHKPAEFQGWVEACGMKRPDEGFQSKEAEAIGGKAFHDMPYEEQKKALTYLKEFYDKTLGQNTRCLATSCTNQDTIRIMKELGLDISWGYCWNYFCEGMNHKGSLFYPFYISSQNHDAPDQDPAGKKVLAIHWGCASMVIYIHAEIQARHGGPGFCLNPLEMANRSEGLDKFDHHRRVLAEWASWARYNPFAHLSLQLEGVWTSEDELGQDLYDQFPTFNSHNTEVFYTQIETALRLGAKPVTFSGLADWIAQNINDTPEMAFMTEDPLPDVRNRGKDQAYAPMVLYGSKTHQYWFDRSRGFNYVRRYSYTPVVPETQITDEYPFADEPRVYLKLKHSVNLRTGVILEPEAIRYEVSDFDLSAYHDDPDYAAILWQANIPSYVKDSDIEIGGAIRRFKTIREKNVALVFADLKKGLNPMVFRSSLPGRFIRVVASEKIGKRWEIWYQNDADEVMVQKLESTLAPGLRIGGFWWDGRYSRTTLRYGWSHYDADTGKFYLLAYYPAALKLNRGLTRFSLELL